MLADEIGTISDTYTYDAFGNLIDTTGSTENSFLYAGEQFDFNTGFYYLRARYMNPNTGTFITMDPYQGSLFDPVSLHKYLYANANPIMYSDPTGYYSLGEMSIAMNIQTALDDLYNVHISAMISGLTSMTYTILKGGGAEEVLKSFTNGYATGLVFTGFGKLALVSQTVKLVMAISALGSIGAGYYQAWKDYQAGDKEAAVFLAVLSSFGAIGWARQYGGDVVDFVGSKLEAAGNNAGVGELYHSANPKFVDVMMKDGFNTNIPSAHLAFKNNRFGRGVYLGDSPATVLAERSGGTVLRVQADLGKNLNIVNRGVIGGSDYTMTQAIARGARKHGYDSISFLSKAAQEQGFTGINTMIFDPKRAVIKGVLQ